jgi:hypothetical protein
MVRRDSALRTAQHPRVNPSPLSGPDGTSPFVRKEELSHSKLFAARSGTSSGSRFRYLVTDPTQWTAEHFQSLYASTAPTAETEIEDEVG